ncbi:MULTISPECIES: DUF732 domain-containing protein [Mycolicibacterium]|uniref:DUF732 domain-containing protein n=1 Tax=Mycolicibacterium neoaurum TaxID=1795 RepID=A0AAV2WMM9_MYCNE|nr:DUF732 domain-containing protein [Mycolicibacterium neoaurum]QVI29042.1 DUF732 domain-containing protein [Mycolicibacterium neoaurum]TLH57419.1 DUF732 domain-containing protein [Mycolicibacterium neoaurum]CDQ45167.1 hypothetical protein BN1047_03055 [Mycolicibacterium neoaurum]SDC35905.1 Protein of unknown function [Mycolicibacterium neoaurum]
MTVTRLLAAVVLAAGAGLGAAAPAAAEELTQEQFLAAIAQQGVQVGSDEDAVRIAQRMCEIAGDGSGAKLQKAVYYVRDHTKLSKDGVTTFAGIAARVYCPDVLPS